MALPEGKTQATEIEDEDDIGFIHDGPAHHPDAPPDELFDISTTVDPSYIISLIRKLLPKGTRNGGNSVADNLRGTVTDDTDKCVGSVRMDTIDESACERDCENSMERRKGLNTSVAEEEWEQHGCILWDLAASKTHAELMVDNLILEVLLANLTVSQSLRVTEICLGIIGNIACHEVLMTRIVSTDRLVNVIIEQLLLDDTQCLSELCRILTSGVQCTEYIIWAQSLQSEHVLRRILWITENTLNAQLIEKSIGLFLAILEGRPEVGSILIPSLMAFGLANVLVDLLSFEMAKFMSERLPERFSVLDVILRAIEALSVIDGHSQEICSNKELFRIVNSLIKFSDKADVATSCATAGVLIANILSDTPDLASEISQDFSFLSGLLDILPLASEDLEAKKALWSVIARLLVKVREDDLNFSSLHQYVLVFLSKSDVIEDDLLDKELDDSCHENERLQSSSTNSNARVLSIRRIVCILNRWNSTKNYQEANKGIIECFPSEVQIRRLVDLCQKYIEYVSKVDHYASIDGSFVTSFHIPQWRGEDMFHRGQSARIDRV